MSVAYRARGRCGCQGTVVRPPMADKDHIRRCIVTGYKTAMAMVLALVLSVIFPSAFAAQACKGLEESKCGDNVSCTWVKGYTTKQGKPVDPYCRTKRQVSKSGK